MNRNLIGASSALAILVLLTGMPATSQADGHKSSKLCNVILDGDGEPIKESDSDEIAHSNSGPCADDEGGVENVENTGQQETAAVQAPEPAATVEPLTVFFETNSDSLNAEARAEVQAYVAALMATSPKGLAVVGYTDSSGPADLNARLSEARANSVAVAMIDAGVPADIIARSASGEESPAVATGDGQREASNRRVTVTPTY